VKTSHQYHSNRKKKSHNNNVELDVGVRRGANFEGRGIEKKIAIPFINFG
jgi:hypothetical protein